LQVKELELEKLQEKLEKDLDLVGCTAIEDKLQEEVGATISFMKTAGIKVWVLTGDKIETAINVGYSCELISKGMMKYFLTSKDAVLIHEQLCEIIQLFKTGQGQANSALIISGEALTQISKDQTLKQEFLKLAEKTSVVLACRVSPKQKAEIVNLVKNKKKNSTTLSIGDGANDVNMITAAHVGIGISGLEGQQAARSADYAIG
jgi:phospholipid-transporting ATPase